MCVRAYLFQVTDSRRMHLSGQLSTSSRIQLVTVKVNTHTQFRSCRLTNSEQMGGIGFNGLPSCLFDRKHAFLTEHIDILDRYV